jgi:hypothetical protein
MTEFAGPQELPTNLEDEARLRVNAALRAALQREFAANPGTTVALFGQGSVRGVDDLDPGREESP